MCVRRALYIVNDLLGLFDIAMGREDATEFSSWQLFLFCVCTFQLPVHLLIVMYMAPCEIVLFDTEIVVNASVYDVHSRPYIERVLNTRVDVPLAPFVVLTAICVFGFALVCASVYQSGYISSAPVGDNWGSDLAVWSFVYWAVFMGMHLYIIMCLLNPVEYHFLLVAAIVPPLSVYRVCAAAVSDTSDEARRPKLVELCASFDALVGCGVAVLVLLSVHTPCRLSLLFTLFVVDSLAVIGHAYDGPQSQLVTIFNCRLTIAALLATLSLVIVLAWRYVLMDAGFVVSRM